MHRRSADEAHRASTPLELLFDLVFVVAIAQVASGLHHGISDAHPLESVVSFAQVFFAIWWAWMNFTWFASAYDNDDVLYRLAVFVQLSGALILAVGVPQAFDTNNFTIVTLGYIVMRLAMMAQWLRVARADDLGRTTAYRYVIGLTVVQAGWVALLFIPAELKPIGFLLLVITELLVPIWAERVVASSWHAAHITERYGLFTIIVIGESILSASGAIQSAFQQGDLNGNLATTIVGGLLIIFSMWWLYFDQPADELLTSARQAFGWGYGHLLIFASAAAVGAGLAVNVDFATARAKIGQFGAGAAVAIPVAIFLLSLWALHFRSRPTTNRLQLFAAPATALLVLLSPLSGQAVLLTGLLLSGLLTIKLFNSYQPALPYP